ncbi:class I SAM-dependent methyltransferase [Plantactinospora sp. WMMB782]|uniref:class I SAM-dependent methyltransferase n=1 Tax=Plantactinospora sp. WMMB782 TaxID=3404121 RepID=UPI003B9655D3
MSSSSVRTSVARLIRFPVRVLVRSNRRINTAWWNAQYALGFWRYLDDMSDGELPLSLIETWAPRPTILDLGCGTSANLPLVPGRYRHYHGVDLSSRAIEAARALGRPDTSFEVADIRSFHTDRRYDAILLREVVYYLTPAEAADLLRRLPAMLTPRGRIVVQIYAETPAEEFARVVRDCGLSVAEEAPARLGDGSAGGAFFVLTGRPGTGRAGSRSGRSTTGTTTVAEGRLRGGSAGMDPTEQAQGRVAAEAGPVQAAPAVPPGRVEPGAGVRPGPAAPTRAAR